MALYTTNSCPCRFLVALESHRKEGGVIGRGARYTKNQNALVSGMRSIGFETLLGERWLSPIIVTPFWIVIFLVLFP